MPLAIACLFALPYQTLLQELYPAMSTDTRPALNYIHAQNPTFQGINGINRKFYTPSLRSDPLSSPATLN